MPLAIACLQMLMDVIDVVVIVILVVIVTLVVVDAAVVILVVIDAVVVNVILVAIVILVVNVIVILVVNYAAAENLLIPCLLGGVWCDRGACRYSHSTGDQEAWVRNAVEQLQKFARWQTLSNLQ